MKKPIRRILRITGFTVGGVLLLVCIAAGIVANFVFTPSKLTPAVVEAANRSIKGRLGLGSVELTFFSTFPRLGLRLTDGTLVSSALRDSLWQRPDTLLTFREAELVINPVEYLKHRKVNIRRLLLDSARVYAFKDADGRANWDLFEADTLQSDTTADTARLIREIAVRHVALRRTTVTFDDRQTRLFANVWDTDLDLTARLQEGHSRLALDLRNRNILFWQDGDLILNRISAHLRTAVELDRSEKLLTLHDARIDLNGTEFDLKGTLRRDTAARALAVDLQYGLHAPSLETVLRMIPESVLKRGEVEAAGRVEIGGTVHGYYGRRSVPLITLQAEIEEASARYAGMPYGIDRLDARLEGQVDLMRGEPSYCNLEIFRFQGAHTDVLADASIRDLLGDPDISFHTRSTIDLTALARTFPLQEGVSIEGAAEADLTLRCRLSTLRNHDFGRIRAKGRLKMDSLALHDTNRDFHFTSHASLLFAGDDRLGAHAEIDKIDLRSPQLNSAVEKLTASVRTGPLQDTTRIAELECRMEMDRFRTAAGDSLRLFCGKTKATVRLSPSRRNPARPQIGLTMEADTLFCRMGDTRAGMDRAGFAVTAERLRDSLWVPKGIIGFNRLFFASSQFALPIRMQKTSLTVGNRAITLRNATMRIGRSDITASGAVYDLYGAMRRRRKLRAELNITSRNLNCNQLIRSFASPADTLTAESDTTSTDLRLFVVPRNIDFRLQTDLRRVRYGRLVFKQVHGAVEIRDQAVHLRELSMKSMGATLHTTLLYQARRPDEGHAGLDFRLRDIDIARLVEMTPSLDSIVPMLRSFEGRVNCDVTAEGELDSLLRIRIPTLRAAMHIEGDSLVLMDGETFAEISKKFLFKNKERNLIDSISVNISVEDGFVTVYPFEIALDRYRAAVGGTQDLEMNFDYHISILKSPIPFKLGLNITGNLEKMKFGLGKAKYKNSVTPAEIYKVDSTIADMGRRIVEDFRKLIREVPEPARRSIPDQRRRRRPDTMPPSYDADTTTGATTGGPPALPDRRQHPDGGTGGRPDRPEV